MRRSVCVEGCKRPRTTGRSSITAAYASKLARPFAAFVFTLIAVPFGLRPVRGGGTGLGFGLALTPTTAIEVELKRDRVGEIEGRDVDHDRVRSGREVELSVRRQARDLDPWRQIQCAVRLQVEKVVGVGQTIDRRQHGLPGRGVAQCHFESIRRVAAGLMQQTAQDREP